LREYCSLVSFASVYASLMHDHMAWCSVDTITGLCIQPHQTSLATLTLPTLTIHSQLVSNPEAATTSLLHCSSSFIRFIYLKWTVATYNQEGSDQGYTFRLPAWPQSLAKGLSSTLTRFSKNSGCLPQYYASGVDKALVPPGTSTNATHRVYYLFAYMHRTRVHVDVVQDRTEETTTDRQLFQS
jgi:hypothetical protein